jgi:NAD-dependent oxidoreductase involved in siderophore biosynthesis
MRPHLVPSTRIVSGFIHNGQPGDIEAVMVNGVFIMKDHKVLTMDEDSLIHEADRIGQRAWRNLIRDYPNLPFPFQFTV